MDLVIFTCVSGKLFQRAIGAYQLAGFLRQHDYTVQVVDFTDDLSDDDFNSIIDRYVTSETLAIGISSTFYSALEDRFISADKKDDFMAVIPQNVENAVRHAKSLYPKLKVVFGGSRSKAGESLDYVDCVIHGYAEDKLKMYLDELSGKGRVFQYVRKDLMIVPINQQKVSGKRVFRQDGDHTSFNIEELSHRFAPEDHVLPGEVLPIEISRGCIFKCKFCAFPLNGKKKLDYLRDPKLIADELTANYEQFGTMNYFINDDTFNDSTKKLEDLHREITKLPFKINFVCYLRPDLLYAHLEQIQLLRELGLASPFFGIESLNQKSATAIGKGMNSSKLKDFLLELYFDHWKAEVPITCSYIVGLPHETEATVRETFNWVKTTPLSSIFFGLTLDVRSFYKSEFQQDSHKYGYETVDGRWRNEHFTQSRAVELAEEFNRELMYTSDRPSSWFLMTLLNHGLDLKTARETRVKDLDWRSLLRVKKQKINDYKSRLLGAPCST